MTPSKTAKRGRWTAWLAIAVTIAVVAGWSTLRILDLSPSKLTVDASSTILSDAIIQTNQADQSGEPPLSEVSTPRRTGSVEKSEPSRGTNATSQIRPPAVAEPTFAASALPVVNVASESQRIPFNGVIQELCVAANGARLVLRVREASKLTIYDVHQRRVVGEVPIEDDPICFAAGQSKLVVGLWGQSVIQRWDLTSLQLEQERLVVSEMVPIRLAMGSASEGPVLSLDARNKSRLLDLQTLDVAEITANASPDRWKHYPSSQHRVSANGRLFCAWDFRTSIAGVNVLEVEGNKATYRTYDDSVGHVCPDALGEYVFTGLGRYRNDERPNQAARVPGYLIPAVNSRFFVRIDTEAGGTSSRVTLFDQAMDQPLALLEGIAFPNVADITVRSDFDKKLGMPFPPDLRLLVIPSENQLVTIAADRTSLQVWPCDFSKWIHE